MSLKSISHRFENTKQLQNAFLPFVSNGGILIPTTEKVELGEKIIVELLLPDNHSVRFTGKVIWTTPDIKHDIQPTIGIEFSEENAGEIRGKVNSYFKKVAEKA